MYRKIIYGIVGILCIISDAYAQNHIEALRYSQMFYSSTGKSEAMGNSLSAVGADMSAATINPAGIAVFKSSQLAFTPNFIFNGTKSNFSNNTNENYKLGFNLSNVSFISVLKLTGAVKNLNFGLTYNSTGDYRQNTFISADNQSGSMLDFIVYNANINRYSPLREGLAWRGWLLNYDDTQDEYWSYVTDDGTYGITQKNSVSTRGGSGEYDLSLGANIGDHLYIGATIGFASVNYHEESTLTETNFPDIYAPAELPGDSILANPDRIEYYQDLYTSGSGVNFKLGTIFQPLKFLRIGAAIHSPTFYEFEDEYNTEMYISYPVADDLGYYDYRPDTSNIFQWNLVTPLRATAGIALILDSYQFGKFYSVPLTFSLDYEYVDYSMARLNSGYYGDDSFEQENDNISNLYKQTHNFRTGLELNFGVFKVRGGYAMYQSPQAIDDNLFENAKVVYSGGLGFAAEHAFVDLSYSISPTNSTMYVYNAENIYPEDPIGSISEPTASIDNIKQFYKITFGLKF